MIASLFMYHYPQLTAANRRYWSLIRTHLDSLGINSPDKLKQKSGTMADWQDPTLVLSQTCGMPYRLWLHDKVELVGTPDYGLDNCPAGYYRSALVARVDDPRSCLEEFQTGVLAFNSVHSQSGYAAPYWHARSHGFWFENRLEVGAHLHAGRAVAEGEADIAALDAVSWTLMQRHVDFTRELRALEWTTPTPGLPYITASGSNTQAIFTAVARAIRELSSADRADLLIKDIVRISKEDYLAVKNPEH